MTSRGSVLRLAKSVLESAKAELLSYDPEEERMDRGPREIVVAEDIELETYLKYRRKDKLPVHVRMRLIEGKVAIYEVPLDLHAAVQVEIASQMRAWNRGGLVVGASTDVIVGQDSCFECDAFVRPIRRVPGLIMNTMGMPYATLVIEIGTSQTLPNLHEKAAFYFSPRTSIMIYLAIKIFEAPQNGTRAMVALLYMRNNRNPLVPQVISFGSADLPPRSVSDISNIGGVPRGVGFGGLPCDGSGIALYQLQFPTAELFNGVPVNERPPRLPNSYSLDLFDIQFEVFKAFL